jgi:hypothetical protein
MGSGSGGGGGGGSGGATAGGGEGYGGYQVKGGRLLVHNADATEKAEALRSVLKKLRPEYLHEQFVDSTARDVYHELSLINVDLCINRSWNGISRRLDVDDGQGCLPRLATALMRRLEGEDRNKKSRSFVRIALENFLLRSLGDDSQLFLSGSSEQVIRHLNHGVFEHQSSLFLGDLLYEIVRAEERALPPQVKLALRGVVQATADRIVSDFEKRFKGKALGNIPQISYGHLFDVIGSEEDWFLDQLRR